MAREAKDVHLLVVPDLDGFPDGIREVLMQQGFMTSICSSIHEVAQNIRSHQSPLIVANCKGDESAFIKELIERESLRKAPVLLTGKNVANFKEALEKFFPVVETLSYPLKRPDINSALRLILDRYPEARPSAKLETEIEETSEVLETFTSLTETDLPTLVFTQISQLPVANYGGSELNKNITFEKLEALGLTPKKEETKKAVDDIQERIDLWSGDHIRRTTYICDCFQRALNIPPQIRDATNHAALLIPASISNHSLSILRANYLTSKNDARAAFVGKLKDSALYIMSELEEKEIAKILGVMSRQIIEEELPNDSVEHLAASLLAAAELINRNCFQNGYWEPRQAHFLIRAVTDGKLGMLHPLSTACMMKFFSEALAELPKTFLIKKLQKGNPELIEKAKENEAYVPKENEKKIPISHLEPGMKLSRPIYAFDGREILSSEIMLDQDLIWRLWRLSAIRPMNTPLIVEESK